MTFFGKLKHSLIDYFAPSEGLKKQKAINKEGAKLVKLMDTSKPWFGHGFVVTLCIVLLVKSMLVTWVRIPSGSMSTSLVIGDWVLMNNSAYSLRIPFTKEHLTSISSPNRGDVVTYKSYLAGRNRTLIKRVIGISGDTVTLVGTKLYVNGNLIRKGMVDTLSGYVVFKEELEGKSYFVQYKKGQVTESAGWREGSWTVPEGHVFLMGDNRDNSYDSRFSEIGYVPLKNLMGKAITVIGQLNPSKMTLERVGCSVYETSGRVPMDTKCI
ncbi:signal peptidase I [Vibrio sp. D431a]|uniref:signal peptidase I n=1 Tax=Vibrio sp. D431a TaxID=2837388 RepID=UPI00255266FC|nr:signal peptidase I [Vibrio sp. D431a]MDK9790692.1 signal peptidase I [Vibrio sp. D431a]